MNLGGAALAFSASAPWANASSAVMAQAELRPRTRPNLTDWQFVQMIDALNFAFGDLLRAPWATTFDWDGWRKAAKTLPSRGQPEAGRRVASGDTQLRREAPKVSARAADNSQSSRVPPGIDRLVAEIRRRGYSLRTEEAYAQWVTRFIDFHQGREASTLGGPEIVRFLEYLAVERRVAVNTQNQALNALVFFYSQVLKLPLGDLENFVRAQRPRRLPVVLNRHSVSASGPPVQVAGAGPLTRSVVLGSPAPQLEAPHLRRNRSLPAGTLVGSFHHPGGLIVPVFHYLLC